MLRSGRLSSEAECEAVEMSKEQKRLQAKASQEERDGGLFISFHLFSSSFHRVFINVCRTEVPAGRPNPLLANQRLSGALCRSFCQEDSS